MESGAAITVIRTCDNVKRIYAVKEPLSSFMMEASTAADKLAIGDFKSYYKGHASELAKCITDGVMAYVAMEKIADCSTEFFDSMATHSCNVHSVNIYGQYECGYGISLALEAITNEESVLTLTEDNSHDIIEYAGILLYALRYILVKMHADLSILDEAIERRRADLKALEKLEG